MLLLWVPLCAGLRLLYKPFTPIREKKESGSSSQVGTDSEGAGRSGSARTRQELFSDLLGRRRISTRLACSSGSGTSVCVVVGGVAEWVCGDGSRGTPTGYGLT